MLLFKLPVSYLKKKNKKKHLSKFHSSKVSVPYCESQKRIKSESSGSLFIQMLSKEMIKDKDYKIKRKIREGQRNIFTVHIQVSQETGALPGLSLLFLLAGA